MYIKNPINHKKVLTSAGFTIVELLIVVVVIAILAAITIVSYNGITKQANESSIKSELITAATQLGIAKAETGSYPANTTGVKKSADITFGYNATPDTFCLQATHPNLPSQPFYTTQAGSIQAGECPTSVATMQAFTPSQCAALTTFTGANAAAITSLTDNRGGVTRTYQVAKLADGKCWMLANLKLGSTTGTTTLTPADSNVAANFTLPQLTTTGANEYDLPRAYGPVPGDTGAGATNYGYLYNWSAATAGATRTTNPAGSGNAAYSICPANWRLPSGGTWNAPTNEFSTLNARMAGLSGVNDAGYTSGNYAGTANATNWQLTGPFKGAFSGYWWSGSFVGQGSYGYVWSRSAAASNADYAHYAYFGTGTVSPGYYNDRYDGFGVRCLLN